MVSALLGESYGDSVYRPERRVAIYLVDVAAVGVDDDSLDGIWFCAEVVSCDEALRRLGQIEFGVGDSREDCRRGSCLSDAGAECKHGEEDAYPKKVDRLRILPEHFVPSPKLVDVEIWQRDEPGVEVRRDESICILSRRKTVDDFFDSNGRSSPKKQIRILRIFLHIALI